jgi:hypothetical protein
MVDALRGYGVDSIEYWSQMASDRHASLRYFAQRGGVMVAIRCLDEGVDIPEVSHALVVASSRNPREFIQRRGRVLRISPAKKSATIHDLLVQPDPVSGDLRAETMVIPEIARAILFAGDSMNQGTRIELESELERRGGVFETDVTQGVEEDG